MGRNVRAALAALLVLVLPVVCAADIIDRVLAVVGSAVITQSDVTAALVFGLIPPPATGSDPIAAALDALIRRQLILDEVNRYAAMEVNGAAVSKRMDEIRGQFASAEEYQAKMAQTAMNQTRLRDAVEANVRIDEYMKQRFGVVEPTDDEVKAFYALHQSEFVVPGRRLTQQQMENLVRERLIEEKRNALIDEWVDRLRRRAEVTNLYFVDARR